MYTHTYESWIWCKHIITADFLEEADELEQLCVLVVVVPAHDGDAVVDLVSIGMRGVVHQHTLVYIEREKQKIKIKMFIIIKAFQKKISGNKLKMILI